VAIILRDLPFFEEPTSLSLPGGTVVGIKHHQIVLWVSVTRPGVAVLPGNARRFPAVLDIGFNDNFLIPERQLLTWAGLDPAGMPVVDHLLADGRPIPLREATVWIHPNRPGLRDAFTGAPPFCLELDTGIGLWPTGVPGARRLPLLGLRGLRQGDLQLAIDCRRCRVGMRTPRRSWFFGWV
jgi:hypothetical protein